MLKKSTLALIVSIFILSANVYAMTPTAYQYYLSANYYITTKQYDKAAEDLKKAISFSPTDAMLYLKLAGIYNDLKDWKLAVETYRKAASLKPNDAFIYVSIGNILMQNRDYKGAIDAYKQSYEIAPNYKYNLLNIANAEMLSDNKTEAIKYYKEFLQTYPDHLETHKNLANIFVNQKNYNDAVEEYKFIYKKSPKTFTDFNLFAYSLMKKGDYKNAIEGFKKEIALNPSNADAYANLGISYLNVTPQNKKSALICLERAFELGGDFEALRLDYANLLSYDKQNEKALVQYNKYILTHPDSAEAYYNIGLLQAKKGESAAAITNLQKALKLQPDNTDIKVQLATAYQLNKNFKAANTLYDSIMSSSDNDANVLYNAGLSYNSEKQYLKAINALEKSLSLKNTNETKRELANCYSNYAHTFLDKNDYTSAISYYEKALTYDNKLSSVYSGLAYCYQKTGNPQKSLDLYEKSISFNAKNDRDFVAYGNSLLALNKTEEALSAYKKAIDLNNKNALAHEGLGDVYTKLNMHDEAFKAYKQSVFLDNTLVNANVKLGNMYKENLENDRALICYNTALKYSSNNLFALHNKAVTLYDMDRITEAKSIYNKILTINNKYAMAYYGLGVIAEREKNYNEAINQYNKFLSTSDNESLKTTIQRRISLLKSRI